MRKLRIFESYVQCYETSYTKFFLLFNIDFLR